VVASRSHHLRSVYVADTPATDFVVLGSFDISLIDGNNVVFDFTARFVVARGEELPHGEPRLRSVQVWTDPTDMQAASQKATATLNAQK
jgi:hypothetical protein